MFNKRFSFLLLQVLLIGRSIAISIAQVKKNVSNVKPTGALDEEGPSTLYSANRNRRNYRIQPEPRVRRPRAISSAEFGRVREFDCNVHCPPSNGFRADKLGPDSGGRLH